MTETEIIDALLQREGGWRDEVVRPDHSRDPATNYGITLDTLRRWRQRDFPGAVVTETDLRQLTALQALGIYQQLFVAEPGFTRERIPFEPLRIQLIDFGVNSSPDRAIRWLQRVLYCTRVDGVLGPRTIAQLQRLGAYESEWGYRMINDALVAARSYMIDELVDHGTMRKQDEEGVESRALSFFLARPAP